MPITFYRYGYVAARSKGPGADEQAAITLTELRRQQAAGSLPADAVDGGFVADTIGSKSRKFLHRTMGGHLGLLCRPGDRICVNSFANLITSSKDAVDTLDWALMQKVGLVIVDQKIDSSTPEGLAIL